MESVSLLFGQSELDESFGSDVTLLLFVLREVNLSGKFRPRPKLVYQNFEVHIYYYFFFFFALSLLFSISLDLIFLFFFFSLNSRYFTHQ